VATGQPRPTEVLVAIWAGEDQYARAGDGLAARAVDLHVLDQALAGLDDMFKDPLHRDGFCAWAR
jgi:hypothetical protein